ncbi:MAG: tRNA epoxyqueuosine(34) reductase QueG [Anaerolineales bacterium]
MKERKKLTRALKEEARRAGFPLVGVTLPDPPDHVDFYRDWISKGYHADMDWMATERALQRRSDPMEILPGCQSILVLGMPYPNPKDRKGDGKISSYAWNKDYHDVLPEKMRGLVRFLEDQVGKPVPNRIYTDTGPILERELARRAGLGWFGKNTTLINPRWGSFFFLAELFLGITLEPDAPFEEEHCGTCTRCLDACPTGSLKEPYLLDANLCLSYLTIERKGPIPPELRPKMDQWIFGCDICQQVCPWNQKPPKKRDIIETLRPRPETTRVKLRDEISLSEEAFRETFKGSPVKRAKRRGYVRNVAVALGNEGENDSVPALTGALHDPEPLVRGHAAWALGQLGGEGAQQALQEAPSGEEDPYVKGEIERALQRWG